MLVVGSMSGGGGGQKFLRTTLAFENRRDFVSCWLQVRDGLSRVARSGEAYRRFGVGDVADAALDGTGCRGKAFKDYKCTEMTGQDAVEVVGMHVVGSWRWGAVPSDLHCVICENAFELPCANCEIPGDFCPPAFGLCGHVFHLHCIGVYASRLFSKVAVCR